MTPRRKSSAKRARRGRGAQRRGASGRSIAIRLALITLAAAGVYVTADRIGRDPDARPKYSADSRAGSKLVARTAATPIDVTEVPQTYDISTRVDGYAAGDHVQSTERLRVRRPFDSRLETWKGGRAVGEPAVLVATFGRVDVLAHESSAANNVAVPPFTAGSDTRLDVVLGSLVADKRVEAREVREVVGRRCQVFRAAKSFREGTVTAATTEEFVDSCIDASGLVIEEVTVNGSRILTRRLATRVETGMTLEDSLFPHDAPPTSTPAQGRGSVRSVDPASRSIGAFWELEAAPEGFARHGRYAVVVPHVPPGPDEDPEQARRRRVASVADVWVRGADVLIIDQGGTVGSVRALEVPADAPTVELGPLGTGALMADTRMSELRILRPGGKFVRILGTVPSAQLEAIARALRLTEGSGLTYLD